MVQLLRCVMPVILAAGLLVNAAVAQEPKSSDEKPPGATQDKTAPSHELKVGDAAPAFELKGCDGKAYKLSDFGDKVVVLEWMNQDCPFSNYVKGAGPRIKSLCEQYRDKGVVWLSIDSTHYQTAEKAAEYTRENKVPYPILMDTDGKVGRLYGARTTPHCFVIHKGKIVYTGAFDNNPTGEKPQSECRGYVADAIAATLAGKEVPLPSTRPWGCTVKYKKTEK